MSRQGDAKVSSLPPLLVCACACALTGIVQNQALPSPPGEQPDGVRYNLATLLDPDGASSGLILRDIHAALIKVRWEEEEGGRAGGAWWSVGVGGASSGLILRDIHAALIKVRWEEDGVEGRRGRRGSVG